MCEENFLSGFFFSENNNKSTLFSCLFIRRDLNKYKEFFLTCPWGLTESNIFSLSFYDFFLYRQRKARLLKAAEPKRHYHKKFKKLFVTDRQTDRQMKLRTNTHSCELIIDIIVDSGPVKSRNFINRKFLCKIYQIKIISLFPKPLLFLLDKCFFALFLKKSCSNNF